MCDTPLKGTDDKLSVVTPRDRRIGRGEVNEGDKEEENKGDCSDETLWDVTKEPTRPLDLVPLPCHRIEAALLLLLLLLSLLLELSSVAVLQGRDRGADDGWTRGIRLCVCPDLWTRSLDDRWRGHAGKRRVSLHPPFTRSLLAPRPPRQEKQKNG